MVEGGHERAHTNTPPHTPPRKRQDDHHHHGKDLKSQEFEQALTTPVNKRTTQQTARLTTWLTSLPDLQRLSAPALSSLVHHSHGIELFTGQVVYRAGDVADCFYIIAQGTVTLFDSKDKDTDEDADPAVGSFGTNQYFGEEDILANSRRAFSAVVTENGTLILRVTVEEYKKALADIQSEVFDAKVSFLYSLAPLRPLREDVVRKLAPCFQEVSFRQKDMIVRQGEKADAMYAVMSGSCSVFVDPHYKEASGQLGETDPKKTLQVVTLDSGAIIGDIAILATVRKRTASVQATSDVVAYKIRRSMFVRRLPADQLQILRRLATEKLKLTDKKIQSRPPKGLLDQILHGHNLRQLFNQQARAEGRTADQPEEYQQLIHVLRRYKRAAAPRATPKRLVPTSASGSDLSLSKTPIPIKPGLSGSGGMSSAMAATTELLAAAAGVGPRPATTGGSPGFSTSGSSLTAGGVTVTSRAPSTHPDWLPHRASTPVGGLGQLGAVFGSGLGGPMQVGAGAGAAPSPRTSTSGPGNGTYAIAKAMGGGGVALSASRAVASAVARSFPPAPGAGYALPPPDLVGRPQWRPISPRRSMALNAAAAGSQSGSTPVTFNYAARPFIAAVTLRTLTAEGAEAMAAAGEAGGSGASTPTAPRTPALGLRSGSPASLGLGPGGRRSPSPPHASSPQPAPPVAGGGPTVTTVTPEGHTYQQQHTTHGVNSSGARGKGDAYDALYVAAPPPPAHASSRAPGTRAQSATPLSARSRPPESGTLGQGSWSSTNLGLPRGLDAPAGGLGRFLTHLDLHDDVSAATKSKEAAEQLEAALDQLALPIMSAKPGHVLRKGQSHYRPTLPRAIL